MAFISERLALILCISSLEMGAVTAAQPRPRIMRTQGEVTVNADGSTSQLSRVSMSKEERETEGEREAQEERVYASALARAGIDPANYSAAYDHLYDENGYHSDPEYTHEGPWIKRLDQLAQGLKQNGSKAFTKVIVLGCSHGKGASLLHELGYDVWGVDVAQKAVKQANKLRGNTCGSQTQECFLQGSLTKIPFGDNQFDAGMSSDVLEHISPKDVPTVVFEISRVVSKYLMVSIASFPERAKKGEKNGWKNLHLTQEGKDWWLDKFANENWQLLEDMSTGKYVNLLLKKKHQ